MGKNGTAEYAETAEFFSKRRKTGMIVYLFPALCVLPYLCGLCFFSPLGSQALPLPGSSVHENKRMNEEEAEKAEAPSDKNWMVFGGPGNAGKAGDSFPCRLGLELLTIFTSACSAASAVQLFFQCAIGVSRSETDTQLRSEPATISRHPNHKLIPAVTWRYRQLRRVERKGVK